MAPTSLPKLSTAMNTNAASHYWEWRKRLELRRSVKMDNATSCFYSSSNSLPMILFYCSFLWFTSYVQVPLLCHIRT